MEPDEAAVRMRFVASEVCAMPLITPAGRYRLVCVHLWRMLVVIALATALGTSALAADRATAKVAEKKAGILEEHAVAVGRKKAPLPSAPITQAEVQKVDPAGEAPGLVIGAEASVIKPGEALGAATW